MKTDITVQNSYKEGNYIITLEGIPIHILNNKYNEVKNIIDQYLFQIITNQLKEEIKLKILDVLKQDIRKLKIDKIKKSQSGSMKESYDSNPNIIQ